MLYNENWNNEDSADAAILRQAAALLRERGHTKGTLQNGSGSMCALGAINAAICGNALRYKNVEMSRRLARKLANQLNLPNWFGYDAGYEIEKVVSWNNHPNTPAEEVIAAFEKTADALEGVHAEVL